MINVINLKLRLINFLYFFLRHPVLAYDKPGRIKKRAVHSENFLEGLVCTGNLAFRLYDCFKLNDSGNCIIRKT